MLHGSDKTARHKNFLIILFWQKYQEAREAWSAYTTGTQKVLLREKKLVNDLDLGTVVDKFAVNDSEAVKKEKDRALNSRDRIGTKSYRIL